MKIGYRYIFEYLSERFTVLSACEDNDARYGMPAIYINDTTIGSERIYLLNYSENTERLKGYNILLIVCCPPGFNASTEQEHTENPSEKSCTIYLEITPDNFMRLYGSLVDLFYRETAWEDAIWHLYLDNDNSTVQNYLDVSVDMLDENIVIYYPVDEFQACLYALSKGFSPAKLSDYFNEDGNPYADTADFSLFQRLVDSFEPLIVKIPSKHKHNIEALAIAVREKEEHYVGLLVFPLDNAPPTQAQIWHISRLKTALEMHLNACRSFNGIGPITRHGLLSNLLSEQNNYKQNMKRQLKSLGFSPKTKYVCAVVRIYTESTHTMPLRQFCSLIETMERRCSAIEHESDIIVVYEMGTNAFLAKDFFKKVVEFIAPIKAQVGISNPFVDILLLRSYAALAKVALETGLKTRPDQHVHAFRDIAAHYILSQGTDEFPARMLCAPGVIELLTKSDAGGIDYIDTLRTHMKNSYSASLTARALFIHRGTLQYRLERISQITQMDLENSDDRLYLELSLMLLRQL